MEDMGIDKYDCLFIANSTDYIEYEYFVNLRMYVSKGGRGIVFQHAMLGRPGVRNNPFGDRTPFPDIVPRMADRAEMSEVVIAAKHSALGRIQPGTVMRHMYNDHIIPETGPGAEVIVKNRDENPVVAVGEHGLGKVIFDGNVNINSGAAGEITGLEGFNALIARHGVEWLTGKELIGGGEESGP